MFTNALPLRRDPPATRTLGGSNWDLESVHPTKALAAVPLQVLWLRLPCSRYVKRTRAPGKVTRKRENKAQQPAAGPLTPTATSHLHPETTPLLPHFPLYRPPPRPKVVKV